MADFMQNYNRFASPQQPQQPRQPQVRQFTGQRANVTQQGGGSTAQPVRASPNVGVNNTAFPQQQPTGIPEQEPGQQYQPPVPPWQQPNPPQPQPPSPYPPPQQQPGQQPPQQQPGQQPPTPHQNYQQPPGMEEELRKLYEKYQMPQPFQYNQGQTPTPQFVPGTNPFSGGFQPNTFGGSAPGPVQGPQAGNIPTFNQGYNPVGAPQAQSFQSFNAQGNSGMEQGLQQQIMSALGQPSSYGSDQVMGTFNRLNERLGQEFGAERGRIDEEMARRGLHASSIAGGRLGDLATRQAQAQSDLGSRLLEEQAKIYGQDRATSIAQAMGYGGQQFGNQLAGYQANLAGSGQAFQQDLASRAFAGDQQAMSVLQAMNNAGFNRDSQNQQFQQGMQGAEFQSGQNQQQLANMLGILGFNNQAGQQGFQNQMQTGAFNQGLAQDQFNNQMTSAGFGAGQNQQGFQNALQQYGMNQGAQQQGFNQQQQLLANLLGFGQQQFQNQQTTAQFNSDQDFRQWAQWLASMGLT